MPVDREFILAAFQPPAEPPGGVSAPYRITITPPRVDNMAVGDRVDATPLILRLGVPPRRLDMTRWLDPLAPLGTGVGVHNITRAVTLLTTPERAGAVYPAKGTEAVLAQQLARLTAETAPEAGSKPPTPNGRPMMSLDVYRAHAVCANYLAGLGLAAEAVGAACETLLAYAARLDPEWREYYADIVKACIARRTGLLS
jgi:hypothetical protein